MSAREKRYLIIGGNRFFGKHLAQALLESGSHVTLLNRGQVDDGFGSKVERLKADRADKQALERAVDNRTFSAVFDQVCYDAKEARSAVEIFAKLMPLYLFTSSASVYTDIGFSKPQFSETDYQPELLNIEKEVTRFEHYGEAKRQAEAVFAQQDHFRTIFPRFTFVTGPDDPTKRLFFHVDRVKRGLPVYIPNRNARINFIDSKEAGQCLKFLSEQNTFQGPVNCSSPDSISLKELMNAVAVACKHKEIITDLESDDVHSPYGVAEDFVPAVDLLSSLGFKTASLKSWLPQLLSKLAYP
jgi:nucleoside-diphosphate-sugar epimerase